MNRNPIHAIIKRRQKTTIPEIILTCGTKDDMYERNMDAIKEFEKHGVNYDWFPIEEGAHDYKCFDQGLRYAFERMV